MIPNSTCPVCGFLNPSKVGEAPPGNCTQCGTMLAGLDTTPTAQSIRGARTTPSPLFERIIDLRRAFAWALIYAMAFGVLSGLLALPLLPLLGLSTAMGVPAAAYFGALVGILFGFLWKALEELERKRTWGLLLGAAVGLITGLMNFLVLHAGGYLPEVSPYEHVLVAFAAGAVGGTFIGAFKAED